MIKEVTLKFESIFGKSHCADKNLRWLSMIPNRFVAAKNLGSSSVLKTSEKRRNRAKKRKGDALFSPFLLQA